MIATQISAASILEDRRGETLARLARQHPQFIAEPDTITGGWIVRNVNVPGRFDIVSIDGECSCRQGRVFGLCKHLAAIER